MNKDNIDEVLTSKDKTLEEKEIKDSSEVKKQDTKKAESKGNETPEAPETLADPELNEDPEDVEATSDTDVKDDSDLAPVSPEVLEAPVEESDEIMDIAETEADVDDKGTTPADNEDGMYYTLKHPTKIYKAPDRKSTYTLHQGVVLLVNSWKYPGFTEVQYIVRGMGPSTGFIKR